MGANGVYKRLVCSGRAVEIGQARNRRLKGEANLYRNFIGSLRGPVNGAT